MNRRLRFKNSGTLLRVLEMLLQVLEPVLLYLSFLLLFCGIDALLIAINLDNEILSFLASAAYRAIPFIVALSAAERLECNIYLTILIVFLLSENLDVGYSSIYFMDMFGIKLKKIEMSGLIFQPLIYVLVFYAFGRLFKPKSPLKKLSSALISFACCFLLVNPLLSFIERGFSLLLLLIFTHFQYIAGAILGLIYPFICIFSPLAINTTENAIIVINQGNILLPAICASNAAIAGAVLAVAIKGKSKYIKLSSLFSSMASLFGFSAAALFGIVLFSKKRLLASVLGGTLGGTLISLSVIKIPSNVQEGLSAFFYIENSSRWIFLMAILLSFLTSFIISFSKRKC